MQLYCHYFSHVLGYNTEINVIIPTPEGNEQITEKWKTSRYDYEAGMPVVYLLHGAYGDCNSWTRFSSIERYVQERNIIAVMASVRNSFYQDCVHGDKYFTYMTEELPFFVTSLFPVSKNREDTWIAGFSMGGYGSWYLALSRPDLYSKAASMSGALDIAGLYQGSNHGTFDSPFVWSDCFNDPEHLSMSDYDLFRLAEKDMKENKMPDLYQACGTKDFLYDMNRYSNDRFTELGVKITYSESEGAMHNWEYWDKEIPTILDWMQGN